jgi:hypothetical protein
MHPSSITRPISHFTPRQPCSSTEFSYASSATAPGSPRRSSESTPFMSNRSRGSPNGRRLSNTCAPSRYVRNRPRSNACSPGLARHHGTTKFGMASAHSPLPKMRAPERSTRSRAASTRWPPPTPSRERSALAIAHADDAIVRVSVKNAYRWSCCKSERDNVVDVSLELRGFDGLLGARA